MLDDQEKATITEENVNQSTREVSASKDNKGNKKPTLSPEEKKKRTTRNRIITAIIAIIVIILLLLRGCSAPPRPTLPADSGFEIDSNVQDGERETQNKDDVIKSLNEKVAQSMINISVNLNPIFERNGEGKLTGNVLIQNSTVNNYAQMVEIFKIVTTMTDVEKEIDGKMVVVQETVETEEVIYTSGAIPVGSRIDMVTLDADLAAGEYKCYAYFHNVDVEKGERLGTARSPMTITVKG